MTAYSNILYHHRLKLGTIALPSKLLYLQLIVPLRIASCTVRMLLSPFSILCQWNVFLNPQKSPKQPYFETFQSNSLGYCTSHTHTICTQLPFIAFVFSFLLLFNFYCLPVLFVNYSQLQTPPCNIHRRSKAGTASIQFGPASEIPIFPHMPYAIATHYKRTVCKLATGIRGTFIVSIYASCLCLRVIVTLCFAVLYRYSTVLF